MSGLSSSRSLPALALLVALAALPAGQGARAGTGSAVAGAPDRIGGQRVVEIVAGDEHSCARVASGRVWCWGRNNLGQLGDGSTVSSLTPVPVQGLTGVVQIAAGLQHSCVVRTTGRVFCWGANWSGQLGDGSTVQP